MHNRRETLVYSATVFIVCLSEVLVPHQIPKLFIIGLATWGVALFTRWSTRQA